jgi:GH15 family glucan-1,4-alpha-glucosidase
LFPEPTRTAADGTAGALPAHRRARLIGDLHTVALVGTDGTIDWYCCPRFDSPSTFAAILDADHGGLFRISPAGDGWSPGSSTYPTPTSSSHAS